jgi:hypothetical protein
LGHKSVVIEVKVRPSKLLRDVLDVYCLFNGIDLSINGIDRMGILHDGARLWIGDTVERAGLQDGDVLYVDFQMPGD